MPPAPTTYMYMSTCVAQHRQNNVRCLQCMFALALLLIQGAGWCVNLEAGPSEMLYSGMLSVNR